MVMIKPGIPYLDIIYRIKKGFRSQTPIKSAEVLNAKGAIDQGWLQKL